MSGMTLIDHGRLLETLRVEVDLLAEAARHADPDGRVPACPGLTIGETVRHVGSVYRMVLAWLSDGRRPGRWQRDPVPGQPAEDYLLAGFAQLMSEFESRDPSSPAGTWWPEDQTVGFWMRRMAHETLVHRTDVQSAAGVELTGMPDDVAVDGIDEVLLLWFGHKLGVMGVSGTRAGSVAVRSGERIWIARAAPSVAEAYRVPSGVSPPVCDATVTADPMRTYLWLWGRLPNSSIVTEGDVDAVAQTWALLRLATR